MDNPKIRPSIRFTFHILAVLWCSDVAYKLQCVNRKGSGLTHEKNVTHPQHAGIFTPKLFHPIPKCSANPITLNPIGKQ